MKDFVDIGSREGAVHHLRQCTDPHLQEFLEKEADHIEGEETDQSHDRDEDRDRRVLSCQDAVDLLALFAALIDPGFDHTGFTGLHNKAETHVGDRRRSVQPPLLLELDRQMVQELHLILVQFQRLQDQLIPLDDLAGSKAQRNVRSRRMILDQVHDRVQAAVDRSPVVILVTEVLSCGLFLIFGNVDRVIHQFLDALIFGGRDRHNGRTQKSLHRVNINGSVVLFHFVHHIEGHHDRHVHLQQLHGEIEVSLDVGRVHDIDDRLGLFMEHKVSRDQLLLGVGRHGIDARKVRDQRIAVSEDHAVLAVHGHAREIPHMLSRSGQNIKERRLAAVLVAYQRKGQSSALGQRVSASLGVIDAFLAKTRVGTLLTEALIRAVLFFSFLLLWDRLHVDLCGFAKTQGQRIAVDTDLHRIAQRRVFEHRHFRPGNHSHI